MRYKNNLGGRLQRGFFGWFKNKKEVKVKEKTYDEREAEIQSIDDYSNLGGVI